MKPRDALEDDPVKELHRYREELSKRFPTTKEMSDYFASIPPTEEILADLRRQIVEKKERRRKKKESVDRETT